MRRVYQLLFCYFLIAWGNMPTEVNAQQGSDAELKQVVLYSAGLGAFRYEGQVEEQATFDFEIPTDQVSDVFRTINVLDPAASIDFVRVVATADPHIPSQELPKLESRLDLLQSLRGESLEFQLRNETQRTGRLVALESSLEALGDHMVERVRVTLARTAGVETLLLEDVVAFRCLGEKTQSRIDRALSDVLRDSQPDRVNIQVGFKSAKKRTVQVGMMRPVPVWKSSFSLTDDQLVMRVVVDNTSTTDWTNVGLTIADGQPVSFKVDLHQVARLARRSLDLPIGLPGLPPILEESTLPYPSNLSMVTSAPQGYGGMGLGGMMGGGMGGMGGGIGGVMSGRNPFGDHSNASDPFGDSKFARDESDFGLVQQLGLATSAAMADAADGAGDAFVMSFPSVSVPARTSNLLTSPPIEIATELVCVYVEDYNATTPLAACKLVNQTDMLLPAGPITIFAGAKYLGEAMLPRLSPNHSRLVSYALEGAIRVTHLPPQRTETLDSLDFDDEVKLIRVTTRMTQADEYEISNRSSAEREVEIVVDAPDEPWTVDLEADDEAVGDQLRLKTLVPPKTTAVRAFLRSTKAVNQLSFRYADIDELRQIARRSDVAPEAVARIGQIIQRRAALDSIETKQAALKSLLAHNSAEVDRMIRILSTSGLNRETVQKYADRIEELELQRAETASELEAVKKERQDLLEELSASNSLIE